MLFHWPKGSIKYSRIACRWLYRNDDCGRGKTLSGAKIQFSGHNFIAKLRAHHTMFIELTVPLTA